MGAGQRLPGTPEPHHRWEGHGGVIVAGDSFGQRGQRPVLLQHGAGQTRHAWKGTGQALADAGYHVIAIDLRGHGDTSWAADKDYVYEAYIADARAVTEAEFNEPPVLVGASMGGIVSLIATGERQLDTAGLVLVDIAHRTSRKGGERVGSFMQSKRRSGFASLEEASEAISAYQPQRQRPRNLDGLAKNLRLGDDGRYHWHWDPDYRAGRDGDPKEKYARMIQVSESLGHVPVLLVRGGSSDVLPEFAAHEFCELAPHTEYVDIAGADHMITGDQNDAFSDAIVDFLSRRVPAHPT